MSVQMHAEPAADLDARVSKAVRDSGLSQRVIALALGISTSALSARLNGHTHWQLADLPSVAGLPNVTWSQLLPEDAS